MPKPSPLQPGGRIGIIAPGSTPTDREDLAAGCRHLEDRGYKLISGRGSYDSRGYLSGTDEQRLDELTTMFQRDDISALFCARGGYGTLRLLPAVDYDIVREHPKLLVGYSDITALQVAVYAQTGLPSISGPMIASDWHSIDPESEEQFWALVRGDFPQTLPIDSVHRLTCHRPGQATGPLIAGNLSMLTRLLGTPYLPPLDGAILFVEDIDEPPYRIDGMLAALRLAGVLDRLNGMIFGQFTNSTPDPDKPSLTLEEVLDDYVSFVDGPVISNADYGHCSPFTSVPIGVEARLTVRADSADLVVTEPVVEA